LSGYEITDNFTIKLMVMNAEKTIPRGKKGGIAGRIIYIMNRPLSDTNIYSFV